MSAPLVAKLGKSTLSMYLRTNCDRELYFSLFSSNKAVDLEAGGMPVPLSARPNIRLVTDAGVAFENHEYAMLMATFSAPMVQAKAKADGTFTDLDLAKALRAVPTPGFCLQPAIDPESFRSRLLEHNMKLTPVQALAFPKLAGMRPDIVLVRPRTGLLWEVLPTGKRGRLPATHTRTALSVVDVKNTAEGNKSYAAEVVLYSIVLANWLVEEGLQNDYFVSDECFLWTHQEKPALDKLLANPGAVTPEEQFQVVLDTLEPVEFSVIAPSVVRFLTQDVLRVLAQAETHGWASIDIHVGGLCSSCDWLGYDRWLSGDDKARLQAHPDWYCKRITRNTDHLSQLPQLSKGARQVLESEGTHTLTDVRTLPPTAPVLKEHSFLKRQRAHLAQRASAIKSGVTSTDPSAVLAGMAKWNDLQLFIITNFDAAAGCLTGIAFQSAHLNQQADGSWKVHRTEFESTVENNTHRSEWDTLHSFLDRFQQMVVEVRRAREDSGKTGAELEPKTQIYFWEPRQFEELCAAIGRHLPTILSYSGRGNLLPAIAWLFPPDELLPLDSAISPYIVFIGELAQRVVFTPEAHAFTLWATYEAYHEPGFTMKMDSYFQDPFGNGIPRERIYEVWKNQGTIRSGIELKTKSVASADYARTLAKQTRALREITDRLRTEFEPQLRGAAPRLSLTRPSGATGVAFDAKVWIQWAEISAKTAELTRKAEFVLPADVLEASYKALVLTDLIEQLSFTDYHYRVSPDSRESKLDDNAYFVLGDAQTPGLPLETPRSLGLALPPEDDPGYQFYFFTIAQLIRVRLELNREALEAEIELLPRIPNSAEQLAVIHELVAAGLLPVTGDRRPFLMDGLPYSQHKEVRKILKAVGNPAAATPDPAALVALASNPPAAAKGKRSADTPLGDILWQADVLATARPRTAAQAAALATQAAYYAGARRPEYALDSSQRLALAAVAQQRLSLVWGPPGTGKTSTLVAYLLAVIEEANRSGQPRKILLTGPNYRAVEVLVHKLLQELNHLPALPASLFAVYSRSRPATPLPEPPAPHLTAAAVRLSNPVTDAELVACFQNPGVAIFATSAHNARKLAHVLTGDDSTTLPPTFDLVIIDESSQVPLALALFPLATLAPAAEVLIVGDPKQMPPIQALDPPAGAEHLVGSIHHYLLTRFSLPQQQLLVNYRSCEAIVDYARTLGYPPALAASQPALRLHLRQPLTTIPLPASLAAIAPLHPALEAVLDPSRAVTALLYHDTRSSQANRAEAQQAAALAYLLRHAAAAQLAPQAAGFTFSEFTDDEFFKFGIGIVTPHKAQRALVLAQLRALFPLVNYQTLQGAVDTVERFQGGERHTIIVSYGVGDVDIIQGEEEFLMQLERTNVAVSRAMAKCIVLMPFTLAYHLPADSQVSRSAKALKSYLEEFCAHRQSFLQPGGQPVEVRWQ